MLVKCIANRGGTLPKRYLEPRANRDQNTLFPLGVGQTYRVYALAINDGGVWYYVLDDHALDYPMGYPAPLFEVVNGTLPSGWIAASHHNDDQLDIVIAPKAWSEDPYFYDRLTSGDEKATRIFAAFRNQLDTDVVTFPPRLERR